MKKKVAWLLCMAGLCLVLYTIVVSRMENSTDVIFGGAEGAYVKSDSVTFLDMNATPTPEPTVDIWPQLTQSDFTAKSSQVARPILRGSVYPIGSLPAALYKFLIFSFKVSVIFVKLLRHIFSILQYFFAMRK